MNTITVKPGPAKTVILLVLALLAGVGCRDSDDHRWTVETVRPPELDSVQQTRLETVQDSLAQRAAARDSLWDNSRRMLSQPQISVRWNNERPGVKRSIIRGDTLYWLTLNPYLVNTADTAAHIVHFQHLPLPVCRAYYDDSLLKTYDYESIRAIRTSSSLQPDEPFRFKYGGCSIRMQGPGIYTFIAEARLFYQLSKTERALVDRAYKTRPEHQAIKFERNMQATIPLFLASDPLLIRVR